VPSLHGAKRATPHEQLIDELRDSTVPKTEREHAAAREIEKNQDRIAAGHRLALELECLLLDCKDNVVVSRWMDTASEALYEAACAMDSQDVPLEDWPVKLIAALGRAGFAVVPVELPHDVLGRAAIAGVAETGNPKHAWDFLIAATRAA
jgi:hypothetical protein